MIQHHNSVSATWMLNGSNIEFADSSSATNDRLKFGIGADLKKFIIVEQKVTLMILVLAV